MRAAATDTGSREGWTSWGDFLGTGAGSRPGKVFLTCEKAQKAAQGLGIETTTEYRDRYKETEGLPSSPDGVYKL